MTRDDINGVAALKFDVGDFLDVVGELEIRVVACMDGGRMELLSVF